MKHILLLTTGGTIACQNGNQGLSPTFNSETLLSFIPNLPKRYKIETKEIMNLDSSNLQPEDWPIIAKHIEENIDRVDGIIITHGTDTMAYTASMLSFMLQNINIPIIITGSQIPASKFLSDAPGNLYLACLAVEANIKGISIAFHENIFKGCRTTKVRTMGLDAFETISFPVIAKFQATGLQFTPGFNQKPVTEKLISNFSLSPKVFLLKLIPGSNPHIIDMLCQMGYKGIILETFGAGCVNNYKQDLVPAIRNAIKQGVIVAARSQCLYEKSDFTLYKVGETLLEAGVISGGDMTTESIVTKMMWSLGKTSNLEEIRKIFATDLCGEITLPLQ